jgi:hypothetical protein
VDVSRDPGIQKSRDPATWMLATMFTVMLSSISAQARTFSVSLSLSISLCRCWSMKLSKTTVYQRAHENQFEGFCITWCWWLVEVVPALPSSSHIGKLLPQAGARYQAPITRSTLEPRTITTRTRKLNMSVSKISIDHPGHFEAIPTL